jgi:hypothetical protein
MYRGRIGLSAGQKELAANKGVCQLKSASASFYHSTKHSTFGLNRQRTLVPIFKFHFPH